MLYLLSAGVLPIPEGEQAVILVRPLSVEEATRLLRGEEFVSAVGHEGTARFLSRVLRFQVPANRLQVVLRPGDRAVRFLLGRRLPEGRVLSEEELAEYPYRFDLVERVDLETPAGRLTVGPADQEPEFPGLAVRVGDQDVAVVEYCSGHVSVAARIYHPRQEEPVVSAHLYADAPSVDVVLDRDLVADGVREQWTAGGVEYEFGRKVEIAGL